MQWFFPVLREINGGSNARKAWSESCSMATAVDLPAAWLLALCTAQKKRKLFVFLFFFTLCNVRTSWSASCTLLISCYSQSWLLFQAYDTWHLMASRCYFTLSHSDALARFPLRDTVEAKLMKNVSITVPCLLTSGDGLANRIKDLNVWRAHSAGALRVKERVL